MHHDQDLQKFVDYCTKHIAGDEAGEAQIFLDHFFLALGYEDGLKGAGASCEFRIHNEKHKAQWYADLVWKPRVLIEMKKSGEDLQKHFQQSFDYWMKLVPDRPQYTILCNFDEFWIYDFNKNIYEPVDRVKFDQLPKREQSFYFLLPKPLNPSFGADWEKVSKEAAYRVSNAYKQMTDKKRVGGTIATDEALRYILQCVVAMFSEDVQLLPEKIFTRILEECEKDKSVNYDLISGLFRQMNNPKPAAAGKFKDVQYFNGGLFSIVNAIDLREQEINLLASAARQNWDEVNPAIFGSIFEAGMNAGERHTLGAHYTSEADIKMIVYPVIVRPWTERIDKAASLDELYNLLNALRQFKVLDPACGSGNFLFVAFREMKIIEKRLLTLIRAQSVKLAEGNRFKKFLMENPFVSTKQFFGIDTNEYAVELAKVTLMVAKELSLLDTGEAYDRERALPLDNLDLNILCADALFTQWPETDAIIGNPPFQSKNKMQQEFGAEYMNKLRAAYTEVPGRADFCVYWFYKAHRQLKENSFAGLVGTNTIRQNYSREGSLDYITHNGGEIIEAVSSKKWSGEAAVHVSLACWKKGKFDRVKTLYTSENGEELLPHRLSYINSSLSLQTDVTAAKVLECNKHPKKCFQGQTHGHEGFLLSMKDGLKMLQKHSEYSVVLKPFLIGDELVGTVFSQPGRFVMDFSTLDNIIEVQQYKELFKIINEKVYPAILKKAELEKNGKIKLNGMIEHLETWWKLWRSRQEMLGEINSFGRYIACSRVSKRKIFEFISPEIHPNDALTTFVFNDDYSFGIISSEHHWRWWLERCSTMRGDFRYTTTTVWDTFPFPQHPTQKQVEQVTKAAVELRAYRNKMIEQYRLTLRELYTSLETPGKNPLKNLHAALDEAVMNAYGFSSEKDILEQLLELNLEVAALETKGKEVTSPGLPVWIKNKEQFVTEDCVRLRIDEGEGLFKK
ncbi:MAG: class I SAM-dependent DNA methyltransferase [Chitinophagales bacterium]|nr:class I SAM-dependent DNA methyltransferase [Chitinophagales bacterium]